MGLISDYRNRNKLRIVDHLMNESTSIFEAFIKPNSEGSADFSVSYTSTERLLDSFLQGVPFVDGKVNAISHAMNISFEGNRFEESQPLQFQKSCDLSILPTRTNGEDDATQFNKCIREPLERLLKLFLPSADGGEISSTLEGTLQSLRSLPQGIASGMEFLRLNSFATIFEKFAEVIPNKAVILRAPKASVDDSFINSSFSQPVDLIIGNASYKKVIVSSIMITMPDIKYKSGYFDTLSLTLHFSSMADSYLDSSFSEISNFKINT